MSLFRKWWIPLVGIVLMALYLVVDPSTAGWMPKCVFHSVTGLNCPGCGSQRMFHALLQGDFAQAWRYNGFLMVLLPFLIFMIVVDIWGQKWKVRRWVFGTVTIYVFLALVLVWGVARNIFGI